MRICYIYQDQYPWDVRVDKIMNSLADMNYEGHIVCRNRDGLPRKEWVRENLCIHRLWTTSNSMLRNIINFPAFFSPFWLHEIFAVVKESRPDLIIVRDLPMATAALIVGKLTSLPVIMDMAEDYPAMIQDTWTFRGPRPLDYVLRNPKLLRMLEKWLVPRLDGFLVVSNLSKERVQKLIGSLQKPIWVVGNTPQLQPNETNTHAIVQKLRKFSGLILLYVGGLEEGRGLETVIRAVPLIKKEIGGLLLVIVGKGSSEIKLKELVRELCVEDSVVFGGWIEPKYIPLIISEADIGLIPHYVTEHTNTTLPNKLFDYMAQKKPVIVTNSRSLKEIVLSNQCGRVYNDKDASQLKRAVMELTDPDLRKKLGEAGINAVLRQYNWNIDRKILLEAISQFSSGRPRETYPVLKKNEDPSNGD
jgi:glycosyltransferase involved in cell wall biosynthesis